MFKLLIILLIASTFEETVQACTCHFVNDTAVNIENTDIIISGKIISVHTEISNPGDTIVHPTAFLFKNAIYQMVVSNVYNGHRISDTIEIETGLGGGDCGFNFIVGQTYIVFASSRNEKYWRKNKRIQTNICTMTNFYSEALHQRLTAIVK